MRIYDTLRRLMNPTREEIIEDIKKRDPELHKKMFRKFPNMTKEQVENLHMMFL